MKKLLFLAAAVMLIAAACNSQTSQNGNTTAENSQGQNEDQNQVDATVNDMNASIDSEASVSAQSDADLINSEQSVTTDAQGVTNVNY